MSNIDYWKNMLLQDQDVKGALSLVPSENILSPMAKLPYAMDYQARYFLDDQRLFGYWCFPNGARIGEVEHEILLPGLRKLTGCEYVNVRPISGLSAMTIGIAALTEPGDTIFSISPGDGGHASTGFVIEKMGRRQIDIKFCSVDTIDLASFEEAIVKYRPRMIYLDQSTFLSPIDCKPLKEAITRAGLDSLLLYDASHTNGLIFGGCVKNPLVQGADLWCGSTHKTFPGPQKGIICTRNPDLYKRIEKAADHLVSHHHSASVVSLAVTVDEFINCGGSEYANQVVANVNEFSRLLKQLDYRVPAPAEGAHVHQVWFDVPHGSAEMNNKKLSSVGIAANWVGGLPGQQGPGYRVSLAELTRRSADEHDVATLVRLLDQLFRLESDVLPHTLLEALSALSWKLRQPAYCYHPSRIDL
ncbi:hypothetical protein [Pseudomonas sp. UBA6562]|uniref:hypothetical protein n=1 Tax=Pseudomonas sp. UBA6562 TaxID=1947332 RepID=UPI0025D63247|nr:hypothetical protein [Pseudomonas sp. UBA6562]